MGTLLFAAALAAQIQTGADLLAACEQQNTAACDTFIAETTKKWPPPDCYQQRETAEELRQKIVVFVRNSPDKKLDAAIGVASTYWCGQGS